MLKKFKLWSTISSEAKNELSPNLGMREWDALTHEEKENIWNYLRGYFEDEKSDLRISHSISLLNDKHKYKSFGKKFLHNPTIKYARQDFRNIFFEHNQHVILQLLSFFCNEIIKERIEKYPFPKSKTETKEEHQKKKTAWEFEEFDKFKGRINDVFEQFGINVVLTRIGFIFRQDKKITEEIYEPVLNFLSDKKWKEVNRDLSDAFEDYRLTTEKGHSSSITHAISAIQAFLQISIHGKTGKGKLASLINEALRKSLIPNDNLSKQIFKNMESILMEKRQSIGNAHPKKEYANEKNARLVLNLTMVFLQHCIQYL